jgi:hypothetical protein
MRKSIGGSVLVLALLVLSGTAAAHVPGSPPISKEGSFELGRAGEANATYHVYLESLGLPPDSGDTLRISWSVNDGLGPAIDFDIHAHRDATMDVVYRRSAIRVDDAWVVPGPSAYMVLWNNTAAEAVNVTYAFTLIAPVDWTGLLVIPVVVGVTLFLLVVYHRLPRRPS